jgi:hypothetical protein
VLDAGRLQSAAQRLNFALRRFDDQLAGALQILLKRRG